MLENIFPAADLSALFRKRNKENENKSVPVKLTEDAISEGWEVLKKGKSSTRLQREKPIEIRFEDRVWSMLFKMQFGLLSGAEGATLLLDARTPTAPRGEIPIVGIDSEITVAVGTKSLEAYGKYPEFQNELAQLLGLKDRLGKSVNAQWPVAHKRQISLIFFLNNVNLSETDREIARQSNILIFNEDDLAYYEKLANHLGPAAKYQFFSDILPGKSIPGLEIKVPAVKTKMGKHNCYTFPISPEYLLKISYVSHRSKGKASDIATYQRMISRGRLKQIREYISDQGIFPTNIVVNLEKKCIDFQRIKQENSTEEMDASGTSGWLHIRPAFKSAWIIDGQHRLFAYSGHPRAKTAHLTVLAFEGLPPSTQARLFVDINAKQKSVKPSLLQELFAELHWDAESPSIRVQAIISKAVRVLDEDKDSPLLGRIQTADTTKDHTRCITLASLFKALERSNFFIAREGKTEELTEWGPLWADDNQKTLQRTVALVKGWLNTLKEGAPDWWDLGSAEGGGFAMNDSIAACINTLRSVLTHLESLGRKPNQRTNSELLSAAQPYAKVLANYFAHLSSEDRKRYRDLRGSQGQTTRTRRMQQAIRNSFSDFNPAGLDDFLNSEKEQTNLRGKLIIDRLEVLLQKVVVEELKQEFTTDQNSWWSEGVPKSVRLEIAKRQETDDHKRGSREAYFDLLDYRTIATSNWSIFQKLIGLGKNNESKEKQTKWLQEISEWRNQIAHASSGVSLRVDALSQLEGYFEWFKTKTSSLVDPLGEEEFVGESEE